MDRKIETLPLAAKEKTSDRSMWVGTGTRSTIYKERRIKKEREGEKESQK